MKTNTAVMEKEKRARERDVENERMMRSKVSRITISKLVETDK